MIVRETTPGLGLLINDASRGFGAYQGRTYNMVNGNWVDVGPSNTGRDEYIDAGTSTFEPTATSGSTSSSSPESPSIVPGILGSLFQVAGGIATQLLGGTSGYKPPVAPPKTGLAAVPTWAWIAGGAAVVLVGTGVVAVRRSRKGSMAGYHGRKHRRR